MSKLIPIISGVTGTAVIAGGGAYLISTQKTIPTIKDSFKHALIKLDNSEEELLKTKLTKLKAGDILSKNKKLQEAKNQLTKTPETANAGLAELKAACEEIYKESFTNKDSEIFKDFQSYCAKTNKDKVEKDKWNGDGQKPTWTAKHAKLKTPKNPLVEKLLEISKIESNTGDELKGWCKNNGDLVFEGEDDKAFKNIKEFCTKD